MPDDNEFTIKDYERIIDNIVDEYFDQHNLDYSLKGLAKEDMLGENILEIMGQQGAPMMPSGELIPEMER